jgi:nuclear pore complex protein Nup85
MQLVPLHTGVVTEQLVEWFQRNASTLQFGPDALPARIGALVAAIQSAGPTPEEAPGFWECFASMVAMGWTEAAIDLVMLHSCWEEWRMVGLALFTSFCS